jgi:hypothetical protein
MIKMVYEDGVLPRPIERLPDFANAKSRHVLADRLVDAFDLSLASAEAIAGAIVNPSEVRKSVGEPSDPDVERIPVPGGTLLGIRTTVWARRIMPDPRNPRILPSRKHPFAVDPGTGGEDSKFRPVPEPQPVNPSAPTLAELAVEIESRHHLVWAAQMAAHYVLAENDWRKSIASQGVMEAVWLVATTYRHENGDQPVTALTTVEGSSRSTAVHNILGIHSADVPYDSEDTRMRSRIKKLNEAFDRGDLDSDGQVAMRCERIPALILVGFLPHSNGTTGFPTAIKSLVALRHVDPPKPWGEGPENESLADEVLDELYRRNLISEVKRDYFAGSCTKAEARAAHLPDDPVLRASEIIRLFTADDADIHEAIHVAVTSQSTRKRMTQKLMNELATALILRAVSDDRSKVDQIRRYLRYAFSKAAHREDWDATGRSTDQLVKQALKEVRESLATGDTYEPGPASLELAVRASYPLIVKGRLNADRGTSGNDQPDRRNPGEVLDAMRRSVQGVYQLGAALNDYAADRPIHAVDEEGSPRLLADGSGVQKVSDIYLRNEYPPAGKAKAARPGDTPSDHYDRAVEKLANSFLALESAFVALGEVKGEDDQPIVDSRGVEIRLTESWREVLGRIDEEAVIWTRIYRKACGVQPTSATIDNEEEDDEFDDPYAGDDDELVA